MVLLHTCHASSVGFGWYGHCMVEGNGVAVPSRISEHICFPLESTISESILTCR